MDEITQIDLNHYQGTDKDYIFEIVNDDEEETAYNGLSNASFEMWIKPSRGETIKLSTRTGEIAVKDNVIVVSIRNVHTANAKWEMADYDIFTLIDDKISAIVTGTFTLQHSITKEIPKRVITDEM